MENMELRRHLTARLDLVASTLDHLLAELESSERLAIMLNAEIGPDWPPGEYDRGAQEFFRDRLLEGGDKVVRWYGWYAIRRAAVDQPAVVIAACGYFGPPAETGEVEIGYSVVRSFQRRGYGTEIVQALVNIAFADPRVQRVIACTTPQNHASITVLDRTGFVQISSPDDENSILFELPRASKLA